MTNALYQRFQDVARQFGNKTALINGSSCFTYADISKQATRWASYLHNTLGNEPAHVCILSEDPWDYICLTLAIAQLNGSCIPTHCHMQSAQLEKAWLASDVNVVVYNRAFAKNVEKTGNEKLLKIPSDISLPSLSHDEKEVITQTTSTANPDFLITLSSGSTGTPKPISISQRVKLKRAEQTWALYDLTAEDTVLCASPFSHSLGQRLVFVALLLGCTMVHIQRFTPKNWIQQVNLHNVSFVIAVSSHLYALKEILLNHTEDLKSLKTIVTSSAPIDASFKQDIFEKIGCDFHEIYGATEIAVATNLSPAHAQSKYASIGLPCPDIRIRIIDDKLQDCEREQIGEIIVQSPLSFSHYYKCPDITRQAYHDEFFRTGDLGFIDKEGFLHYVSRKKDIIISGGINIYPGDIEEALTSHKNIHQVAVIGVSDTLMGEVIVAICTLNENTPHIEMQLRQIANRKLAPFQRPLKYFFIEEMPLTNSGKLSKLKLRETYTPLNKDWTAPLRLMLYGQSEQTQ